MPRKRHNRSSSHRNEEFRAHPVEASHSKTKNGVCFNVQTVDSLGPRLEPEDDIETKESVDYTASEFYRYSIDYRPRSRRSAPSTTRVESHSVSSNVLVDGFLRSLATIALSAFANHYPLSLRPDDVWLAIAYGFAKHVDSNAEALRSKVVSFDGQKNIVYRNDDLVMGNVPQELLGTGDIPFFQ